MRNVCSLSADQTCRMPTVLLSPITVFAFTSRHQLSVFCILMGIKCFLLYFTGLVPSTLTEECLSVLSPRMEVSLLILGGRPRGCGMERNLTLGSVFSASFQ